MRRKILHVVRGLANSSGTTHIVTPLSEQQALLGHQVSVCFADKGAEEPVVPDTSLVTPRRFPVQVLRGNPGLSFPLARWLNRSVGDYDVVHIHAVWNFPSLYAMKSAWRVGTPYIVAPQGSLEPWALASGSWQRRFYARQVERPYLDRATRLQALSRAEEEQCRSFGLSAPTAIIPNAVDEAWLHVERGNLAQDLGLAPGTKTLLYLSRLHPKKGLDILVRAFAEFSQETQAVDLVIAGGDAGSGYRATIESLIAELGVSSRCHLIGEVRGARKRGIIAGADAYALTSHSEGLPVAVVEAMSCGVPVLITPGCNLPEVFDADAGITVEPTPEAALAGVRELFASPERMETLGRNARSLVERTFTWPRVARLAVAVYEEMIESNQSQRRAAVA